MTAGTARARGRAYGQPNIVGEQRPCASRSSLRAASAAISADCWRNQARTSWPWHAARTSPRSRRKASAGRTARRRGRAAERQRRRGAPRRGRHRIVRRQAVPDRGRRTRRRPALRPTNPGHLPAQRCRRGRSRGKRPDRGDGARRMRLRLGGDNRTRARPVHRRPIVDRIRRTGDRGRPRQRRPTSPNAAGAPGSVRR